MRYGRILLTTVLFLGILTGCGDDDSPTQPDPDPQYFEHIAFRADIQRFESIVDGDGIEGAGEFEWVVRVGFQSMSWEKQLSSGQSHTLDWQVEWAEHYSGGPHDVEIYFACAEWDRDILGNEVRDSDMDWRNATAVESIDGGGEITNMITLGNSNCRVRLHYTLTAEVVRTEI